MPNSVAATAGASAMKPPYPTPMTTAKSTSNQYRSPAPSHRRKLAVSSAKLACIRRLEPKRVPSPPSPSRPTTLAAPITPTSAAAGPGSMP